MFFEVTEDQKAVVKKTKNKNKSISKEITETTKLVFSKLGEKNALSKMLGILTILTYMYISGEGDIAHVNCSRTVTMGCIY